MDVYNERGEQLGDVEGVVRSAVDNKNYVVIDHGGFLGLGEKRIALSMEGLMAQGDRIIVRD
jgi:sporulation protein YlmC with PRC-barrel domain